MTTWGHDGTNYFRPTAIYLKDIILVPAEQRFNKDKVGKTNRININPPRDYFKDHGNPNLTVVNEALDKLAEEEKGTREREEETRAREEEARERRGDQSERRGR